MTPFAFSTNIQTLPRAGPVFLHREGTELLQGDIEFATSLFPDDCPFFVIDNAADFTGAFYRTVQQFRDVGKRSMFLLGERLNEWRHARRGRTGGNEFIIEPLSDPEITRLLDSLEATHELNTLSDLSPELRFAAIKRTYQGELLVALREATEGKGFDAILEDEYRGIPNEMARSLYLIVACFYQHGALVRDSLLAEMLKVPLSDMHAAVNEASEGVILFEDIDPSYGHFAARARHRKIAAIVWERCAEPGQREQIVIDALSSMNLNYRTDVKAFEDFVRSDRLVDSIRTLDGRIRFFEQACQKDPGSAYVRQHYARMLARAEKFNLALGQVEEALKIDSEIRVLHHTKGVILSELALSIESREIARRRLAQSEDEFRTCLSMDDRDEYAYQTLASLYVNWARHSSDSAEVTDYLAKAESVINDGLRRVREREGLWIVSAQIQEFLGNKPEFIEELEKASAASSASTIPKYLLGRAYRKLGKLDDAIRVLKPLVESNPDEFRACVELAAIMNDMGQPYANSIAVLKLGTLYGLSDPRFIGVLGGMLFMNGDFTEARGIFAEARKREFPAHEQSQIQFRPKHSATKSPLTLKGQIGAVKVGYAFIDTPGYPSFFCPGSKFGRLVMRQGMTVEFDPAFSARGPIADRIRVPA